MKERKMFGGFLFFLCIITRISAQESSRATFFISLKEYNNTNSELFDGRCCDGPRSDKCSSDRCDYDINICISTSANGSWCHSTQLDVDQPPELVFKTDGQNVLLLTEWKGSAKIDISISDIDGPNTKELVDKFSFTYTEKGRRTAQFQEKILNGTRAKPSRLRLSLGLQCQTYYYGDECSVFCIPSVDCKGHYTCDEKNGTKVCDQGWEGHDCTRPTVKEGSCTQDPCKNGGTCSVDKFSNTTDSDFFCCCPNGFTGSQCEIDIDECRQNPCQYGGTCRNIPGSYICNCQPRYRGMNCEIPTTCDNHPCQNGKCVNANNGTFSCLCGSKFSGMYCESVITPSTTTTTTTTTTTSTTTTTKPPPTTESTMTTTPTTTTNPTTPTTITTETTLMPLETTETSRPTSELMTSSLKSETQSTTSSPRRTMSTSKYLSPSVTPSNGKVSYNCPINACKNNGKCLAGACQCPVGFSGQLCQTEEIECKSDSCLNGGYCNDNIGNFSCECRSGFVGFRCEKHVGQSTALPSTNACGFCGNGSCSVLENGTSVCMCSSGYSGKTCTYSTKMCRPYSAALCFKGSECVVNSYRPNMDVCPTNWEGPLCRNESIPLSRDLECPRVVCKNDGHCYNGRCCCRSGYKGQFCEEEILRCDSSPCKNGATCVNFFNSFECSCRAGFTGKLCERSLFPMPITTTVPTDTSTRTTRLTTANHTTTVNQPPTTTATTKTLTTNRPTFEISTTEERTTQPTTDSAVLPKSSYVTTETLPSTESVTISTTGFFTEEATTESPKATTDKTTSKTTETHNIDKTTSLDSLFARCRGFQCFLNRTCIDTSYGRTECKCMNIDKASSYIVDCTFIDFPTTTVASSIGSSSSFQTTTTVGSSSSKTTFAVSSTMPVTTQTPSTTPTKPTHPISSTPKETTLVHTTLPPNSGNNSVTLGGKIPDKDIPAVKEAITNAVRNTSKGENCTDINILTTEYLYNKSRDVYTKVIYNSSDCLDASNLHKNPNLTASLNNQLAHSGSLGGHSVYTGKTSGLGKSYQVPLIGIVDKTERTHIKEAIKNTWSNAGNKNVDVLIVDASYRIGQYGIYITDITYLVTSGLTFLQPRTENIPKRASFYDQFNVQFPDRRILMYSGNTSYGYESGLRFSIQQMKRSTALTVAEIYSRARNEWESIIKDHKLCLHQSCHTAMTVSPLEITPTNQRSADVVLYPAINQRLYTESTISNALKMRLSAYYDICNNCNYPRLHYIDVEGRVKLKDEMNLKNKIKTVLGTDDTNWSKSPFISGKNSIATRLYYLPNNPNDTKTTWPQPNMEGKSDLINNSLRSINRKLAIQKIRKLHEVVLTGVTPKSEQHILSDIIGNSWASTNKHVSRGHLNAAIEAWNTNYVSPKGEPVTQVKYTLSVMDADSSIAALSPPSASVLKEVMKSLHNTYCDCKAYQVRMLWTKDMKEFNTTVIQEAVSKAWVALNDGFSLMIPTTVINSEAGYVAGSGDSVRMYSYFIKPRIGAKEVDEDDLDEPTPTQIERELAKLVPGSRVFPTASRKSEPETKKTEWWVYLVIGIGCLALVILILTLLIVALRTRSHRQSRTLKQDPKQMNGYDKEHFSKEPVMEKNSNGLYTVEDEDTDYSKTTYFVNNTYGEPYQK